MLKGGAPAIVAVVDTLATTILGLLDQLEEAREQQAA